MTRLVRDWKEIAVDSLPVAPHRYLWSGAVNAAGEVLGNVADAPDWKAARACVPYQAGEVIYVLNGGGYTRALIAYVGFSRSVYGDRREWYNVQRETKAGYFSKRWTRVHPGFIQHAYQRAGLAPEMPS